MNNTLEVRAETAAVAADICADQSTILQALIQRIGPQKFNAWFRRGTRLSLENNVVRVAVPNAFVANWIETHYQSDIAAAACESGGKPPAVLVSVDPALSGTLRKTQRDSQAQIVDLAAQGRSRSAQPAAQSPLRCRLEDFIVGESNKLAYSAAQAVLGENCPFNPLFVYGPCGVGKTHLLQGVCNLAGRIMRNGRPLSWRYVTAEQFTNEFVTALRQKRVDEFRGRYRQLDMLAIDDVHFLAAKRATQDEFLHTFNAIASGGKRIAMASDAHPRMVGELNEQLVSRFMAGMVVKVSNPDQALRREILRRRCGQLKLHVPAEVLDYLAAHIRGSVRELEGSLLKLSAVAALAGGEVTLAMAAESLADHLARTDSAVTLGDIEAAAAAYFGITVADLHSSRRTRTVCVARMLAMFLTRRHTQMSYPEIGNFMGKNHSSVVLAVQKMEQLLAANGSIEWMTPMGTKTMPAAQLVSLLWEQIA